MKNLFSLLFITVLISCTTETTKDKYQTFAEFAKIYVKGDKGTFRGQNTVAFLMPVASPNLCGWWLPFMQIITPLPFAVDTTEARIKYIIQNGDGVTYLSYRDALNVTSAILYKDTILGQFIFEGQDVLRQKGDGYAYELSRLGAGAFNATITKLRADTLGYIPNRVTARFHLLAKRLYAEGKLDSCEYYMHKMIKFYPLDNGSQYNRLIADGLEPYLADTTAVRQYLEMVKREDGGAYNF